MKVPKLVQEEENSNLHVYANLNKVTKPQIFKLTQCLNILSFRSLQTEEIIDLHDENVIWQ